MIRYEDKIVNYGGLPEQRNDTSFDNRESITRPNITYQRGDTEDLGEFITRITAIVYQLEAVGSTHIRWRTHKNPYGCWICECLQCARLLVSELELVNNRPKRVYKPRKKGKSKP